MARCCASAAFYSTPPAFYTVRNQKLFMSKAKTTVDGDDVRIAHMNHAGASPSPSAVLDCVIRHMKLEQRLGGYTAAQTVQHDLSDVYRNLARLLHASDTSEVALVESATVAWTRLFYSMVQYKEREQQAKKVILVSEAEYAANLVAACQWARDHTNWTVVAIPSTTDENGTSTGILNVTVLEQMLNGSHVVHGEKVLDPSSIALVCVTHVPTNSGIVNPVYQVGRIVEKYNNKAIQQGLDDDGFPSILYLVDACQSVGQMDVNVKDMRCHGLTGTGRKYLRGPRGTGFLYVSRHVTQQLVPDHVDHACAPVMSVPREYPNNTCSVDEILSIAYKDGAARFEFWESNLANKLGLGEAMRIAMDDIGLESITDQCTQFAGAMQERLQSIDGVRLHHGNDSASCKCGIVTFAVRGVDAAVVKERLWLPENKMRFEVSVVPATSTPLDSAQCNVPNLVRTSLSYTNTMEEVNAFCERMEAIIAQHQQERQNDSVNNS